MSPARCEGRACLHVIHELGALLSFMISSSCTTRSVKWDVLHQPALGFLISANLVQSLLTSQCTSGQRVWDLSNPKP